MILILLFPFTLIYFFFLGLFMTLGFNPYRSHWICCLGVSALMFYCIFIHHPT
jgi:hypothetical protein